MTQVEFTTDELLATHELAEPLVANGVRCHGGFDADGTYVSPRTKHRSPAITAWQEKHTATFGTELLHLPLETWPEAYPNVAQSRYLLENGVREPVISTLTRIGTVEGFGAMIRYSLIPDLPKIFDDDLAATAMGHLGALYEAHARDEAGYEDEGGHTAMWFAARDVAFENPVTHDETAIMLERMGIPNVGSGGSIDIAALRAAAMANRVLPDDVDYDVESLIERMVRILLIEIQAFHVFRWAEELLGDTGLVAGDGEAARLVSYIRSDETPHVDYLRTVLTEMRDRTLITESGKRYAGTDIVGPVWDRALAESLGPRRDEGIRVTIKEVEHALDGREDAADLLHRFHELAS